MNKNIYNFTSLQNIRAFFAILKLFFSNQIRNFPVKLYEIRKKSYDTK